ncbi:MAG: putative hydroxymethylpyrimidine transporter CytX [Synergistaceae bacterium]|nr:putative hydroxymethylpyrimidine transporter CytX [Synergistaceae bacterium]
MQETEGTTVFGNALIWFGAAVSIAEIMTGSLIAPLGFAKGAAAVVIGHIIGCIPLYLAGRIGAETGKSAMETVKNSFGQKGSIFFSVLNVTQLVGWTAVMIIGGGRAVAVIAEKYTVIYNSPLWCVVIGILIIVWIKIVIKNLGKINTFTMAALFSLTGLLSFIVFRGDPVCRSLGNMSFGRAVELSAAMPLSWLPLISDYTHNSSNPRKAALVSVLVYFVGSTWMYVIGLGASIFTGESDIAKILLSSGLGLAAVLIIVISTVTTTFLDVYSAGVSFSSITDRVSSRTTAVIACIAGTALAVFTPIEQYENFLFLIGSVFAPMISILITDFFILKKDHFSESLNIFNFILWIAGFVIYRGFMAMETVFGNTLPVMAAVIVLATAAGKTKELILRRGKQKGV